MFHGHVPTKFGSIIVVPIRTDLLILANWIIQRHYIYIVQYVNFCARRSVIF